MNHPVVSASADRSRPSIGIRGPAGGAFSLLRDGRTRLLGVLVGCSLLAFSSIGNANPLADAALLKIYGGFAAPDGGGSHPFVGNDNTVSAFGLDAGTRVTGVDFNHDDGILYGIAIEYFFADHWGVELAWERHETKIDGSRIATVLSDDTMAQQRVSSGDFDNYIYALNFYYDFGPLGKYDLQPYIGIGYLQSDEATLRVGNHDFRDEGHNGIQYIVGFARQLPSNWNFFFDYRRTTLKETNLRNRSVGTIRDVEYDTELLIAGVSVEF